MSEKEKRKTKIRGNADAKVWAEEFVKNAIMAGYDLGKKHRGKNE